MTRLWNFWKSEFSLTEWHGQHCFIDLSFHALFYFEFLFYQFFFSAVSNRSEKQWRHVYRVRVQHKSAPPPPGWVWSWFFGMTEYVLVTFMRPLPVHLPPAATCSPLSRSAQTLRLKKMTSLPRGTVYNCTRRSRSDTDILDAFISVTTSAIAWIGEYFKMVSILRLYLFLFVYASGKFEQPPHSPCAVLQMLIFCKWFDCTHEILISVYFQYNLY